MAKDRIEIDKVVPLEQRAPVRPGQSAGMEHAGQPVLDYGAAERDERARLREVWYVLRKRKLLIAVVVAIATTIVTIEIYRTKSIYQASAVIEVVRNGATMIKQGEVIIQTDDSLDDFYMTTKIMVLKSTPLLEDVVVNLKLDQNPKLLDITRRKSYWEALGTVFGRVQKMVSPEGPPQPAAAITLAAVPRVGSELARTPAESARLAPSVAVLQANVSAEQVQYSRALQVSFSHTEPAIAAAVTNGVAEAFIQRNFRSKTEKYTSASLWLDRMTRELKAKVAQAEQALVDYGRVHNIFTTEAKESLTSDKLSRLHDQVLRAETERILKQSLYEEVKQGRVAQLPESFTDTRTSTLQTKLDELSTNVAQLEVKYGPDNPRIIELKSQMVAIQQQLDANRRTLEAKLKADYERAAREESTLRAAFERSKSEAVEQNQAAIQYGILRQEIETNKAMYTDFLQKTNQANIEVAQQANNLRLIEPAQPPAAPSSPNRPKIIMIGFLLSLMVGVGLAFSVEYLDNTIKSVEDVTRYARMPVLGVVPAMGSSFAPMMAAVRKGIQRSPAGGASSGTASKTEPDQLMMFQGQSALGEAYRVLRTSLLLSAGSAARRTILITSGQPGEGKTTTVINTAVALAQLGSSVLIIDADLRRPRAHKAFGMDPVPGLSTYLSGEVDAGSLIRKTQVPNLSLLTCGPIPPNPAELLSAQKMKGLLTELSAQYDHILIDSPPLMNATDPVILSTMVNGVVVVVHAGKSTREGVRRARQELAKVGARTLGAVLNNLDLRSEGGYGYHYDRYYGGEAESK